MRVSAVRASKRLMQGPTLLSIMGKAEVDATVDGQDRVPLTLQG